jgi:hypothetical protein
MSCPRAARSSITPGAKRFSIFSGPEMLGIELEGGAAVLPVDAAFLQHQPAAIFMIDALDEADGQAVCVHRAQPDRIGRLVAGAPGRRLFHHDLRGGPVEPVGGEDLFDLQRCEIGIGDIGVAQGESLLGGLDQAMDMIGAVRGMAGQSGAFGNAENGQRHRPLSRQGHVEQAPAAESQGGWIDQARLVRQEVLVAQWRTEFFQILGHRAAEIAAIETVQSIGDQSLESGGEARAAHQAAGLGRLAIDQEFPAIAGLLRQFGQLLLGAGGLAGADRKTLAGMMDGVGQKAR